MTRDHPDDKMDEVIVVRMFAVDKERLEEIVRDNPSKYENVSHAVRCAAQHFIKKWGEI